MPFFTITYLSQEFYLPRFAEYIPTGWNLIAIAFIICSSTEQCYRVWMTCFIKLCKSALVSKCSNGPLSLLQPFKLIWENASFAETFLYSNCWNYLPHFSNPSRCSLIVHILQLGKVWDVAKACDNILWSFLFVIERDSCFKLLFDFKGLVYHNLTTHIHALLWLNQVTCRCALFTF